VSDRRLAEARVLRMLLGYSEDDDTWSTDSVTRCLLEFGRCEGCSADVIMVLLDMVTHSCGVHRDEWVAHLQTALVEVLDELGATEP
jgi:hypothetical protein